MQSYVQYILWLYDWDAIISYTCVCTVNAKKKLDYKGHSRLRSTANRRFVRCRRNMIRVWLAYHDDEDDNWMNRFVLIMIFLLVFRRIGNLEIPDRESEQFDRELDIVTVNVRTFGAAKIVFASRNCISVRGKWIRKVHILCCIHLYRFEIVISFRIWFEIKLNIFLRLYTMNIYFVIFIKLLLFFTHDIQIFFPDEVILCLYSFASRLFICNYRIYYIYIYYIIYRGCYITLK